MSALTGNDWRTPETASAEGLVAASAARPYLDRLIAIRDTLIVFGMQVVFRVTMFLRHLNY